MEMSSSPGFEQRQSSVQNIWACFQLSGLNKKQSASISEPFRGFRIVRWKARGVLCSLVLHTSQCSEIEISKFLTWILTCLKPAAWDSAAGQAVTQFVSAHTQLSAFQRQGGCVSSITIQSFRCLFRKKPLKFISCYLGYERGSCSVNYDATQSDLKAFLKIKCQKPRNSTREKGNLGGRSFYISNCIPCKNLFP